MVSSFLVFEKMKKRELFQEAIYNIPDNMNYQGLIIDNNIHLFLQEAQVKAFKIVQAED